MQPMGSAASEYILKSLDRPISLGLSCEDSHTLHLVVRQSDLPSPGSLPNNSATRPFYSSSSAATPFSAARSLLLGRRFGRQAADLVHRRQLWLACTDRLDHIWFQKS